MRTGRLDIRVNRNGSYYEEWRLRSYDGQPINLTDLLIDMKVRATNGQGNVLATAEIVKLDAFDGAISVKLHGSQFSTVPMGREVVTLSYDLRITYPDGVKSIPVAGLILLTPGATY